MLRGIKNNGFASITEVMVTAVIFVLATAGILTTLSALRPHAMESTDAIDATYFGRGILDDLRDEVDATTWNNPGSRLAPGTHSWVEGGYTVNYTVTDLAAPANVRHVVMNITWPD